MRTLSALLKSVRGARGSKEQAGQNFIIVIVIILFLYAKLSTKRISLLIRTGTSNFEEFLLSTALVVPQIPSRIGGATGNNL